MGKSMVMPMAPPEKPKAGLLEAVLPSVWFLKLKSMRKKPIRALKDVPDSSEPVIADSAPFLPKSIENCYRSPVMSSEMCVFTPLQTPPTITLGEHALIVSPGSDRGPYRGFRSMSSPPRKSSSFMLPGVTTIAVTDPVVSSVTTTTATSSIFSRCTYRSTIFSSLRNLCKLVGDEPMVVKGSSTDSFRKSASPTMRTWFLAGCGSIPRTRARHRSMDLEKESGLIELDANTGLECIETSAAGVSPSTWPKKRAESWSGGHPSTWSVDLTNDEVVKKQVVVKKKREPKPGVLMTKISDHSKSPSKPAKPTLGHLFAKASETDSPTKIFPESEEPFEDDEMIHGENNLKQNNAHAPPWRSPSFGSGGDSPFRAPSDVGLSEGGKGLPLSDSEPTHEELDKGNISDSQSVLRAKVLAAERLREGSKSWREQRIMIEKNKEEEATRLLASLDEALEQHNLQKLLEDEEDSDNGCDSRSGSPRFEVHNYPVFESFLESSAKAWGIDFPTLRIDDGKTSGSISDKSRELHCITVHTSVEDHANVEPVREQQSHGRAERGRDASRGVRLNAAPNKVRKSKRFVEKEVPKRRSPSRRPATAKDTREERTHHPQREESMIDPDLHDEFNNARKKLNDARKRSKQRRSKQVASVPDVSPTPPPPPPPPAAEKKPQPHAGVVKERVAVVVESSYDPYNDFRESMIEMIVDQDIRETGDLEELLQCYLSLNEAEYHNVIVDVFTDVWHELFKSNG